jgi:hypothetical protein
MFRNLRFLVSHVLFRNIHDIVQFRVLDLPRVQCECTDICVFQFGLESACEADDACFRDVVG